MKKIYIKISACLLFIYSSSIYADRYGIYEDFELYDGESLIYFVKLMGAIIITILAYYLLYESYIQHKERKENGEKIVRESIAFDYLAPLIGYGFWALLISFPIIITFKLLLGVDIIRSYWYTIYAPCYILVCYIRQT